MVSILKRNKNILREHFDLYLSLNSCTLKTLISHRLKWHQILIRRKRGFF